jgi:murein DD-endopeptidase MepM/ murein hydrolase activator NlpD
MGNRAFPDRQILLHANGRIRLVPLPSWLQATIVVACIATLGGMSYFSFGYFALHRRLAHTVATVSKVPAASGVNRGSAAKIAALDQQFARARQKYIALKQRYAMAAAALPPTGASTGQAPDLKHKLASAQRQLSVDKEAVVQLKDDITGLRAQLRRSEQVRVAKGASADSIQADLRGLTVRASRLQAIAEAKAKQVAALRRKLAPATRATLSTGYVGPPTLASSIANPRVVSGLKEVLATTGVHLGKILHDVSGTPAGLGGPFIPPDNMPTAAVEQQRLNALLKVAKLLPLRSPIDAKYTLASPFGIRRDPFNHRPAFHPGVDLDAPYKSPVYSTAPGVVVFTGWDDGYGKLVKIYHGHGIETYYAHLNRILVAKGEHVAAHVEVGLLGTTGRSTGPHLLYEVCLDGHPVDPVRFLEAGGHLVQASALSHWR